MHREATKALFLGGKNIFVVGGTAGIGEAVAIRYAELGASVTISGRNKEKGAEIVNRMKEISSNKKDSRFEFRAVDMTVMTDVKRMAREYLADNDTLDTLVISAGQLNTGPRKETPEGIENNFAISFLGRFVLANRLLPLLTKTPGARVMSIMSAGEGRGINFDDPQGKKSYWKITSATTNSSFNDLMMEELANRHKDISFFHLHPGTVATDILEKNNVFGATFIKWIASPFMTSAQDYADTVVHIATAPEYPELSGNRIDSKGKLIAKSSYQKEEGVRERAWAYATEVSRLDQD